MYIFGPSVVSVFVVKPENESEMSTQVFREKHRTTAKGHFPTKFVQRSLIHFSYIAEWERDETVCLLALVNVNTQNTQDAITFNSQIFTLSEINKSFWVVPLWCISSTPSYYNVISGEMQNLDNGGASLPYLYVAVIYRLVFYCPTHMHCEHEVTY